MSICVGDVMGQGFPALYVQHSDTHGGLKNIPDNLLIRTSADKQSLEFFDLFSKFPLLSNPYSGRSVAALDLTGTGKHGFYVVNNNSPSLFYTYNSKTESIEEVSQKIGIRQFSTGQSILAQYISNEKSLDIFIGNDNEANVFFTKNSRNKYVDCAILHDFNEEYFETKGVAIADFDGNGYADLVVGNWLGMNSIFMQNENGNFVNLPPALFREPMPIRNIIVADFDNDGNEEIFINNFDEKNKLLRYLGDNDWEEIDIGELELANYSCTGASVGDLTGNGFLDIFITTGEKTNEKNQLFLGVPNGNFWLRIQPLTQNGFPALSSKIRLYCKNFKTQTKFICSGSGYLCQMEPVAHFGLGSVFPEIEKLEITWPGNGKDPPDHRVIPGSLLKSNSFIKIPHPRTGT